MGVETGELLSTLQGPASAGELPCAPCAVCRRCPPAAHECADAGQVNAIATHRSMNQVVCAFDDGFVRLFDPDSGARVEVVGERESERENESESERERERERECVCVCVSE